MAIGRDPRPVLTSLRSAVRPVLFPAAMMGVGVALFAVALLVAFAGHMLFGQSGILLGSVVGGVIASVAFSAFVTWGLGG